MSAHRQIDDYDAPPETNELGLVGFILSACGILTCGLLFPIGMILSGIALLKRPRGFAVAGTIVGGLGTTAIIALVTAVGYAGVLAFFGIKELVKEIETIAQVNAASKRIQQHQVKNGPLPADDRGATIIKGLCDRHSNALRYRRTGERRFEIRSAGKDEQFDTGDDYVGRYAALDALLYASNKVKKQQRETGLLPDDQHGTRIVAAYRDRYGSALQYHRTAPNLFEVRSAGRDRQFQSPDDVVRKNSVRNRRARPNGRFDFDD